MRYLNTSKLDWIINPLALAINTASGSFPPVDPMLYYKEPIGGSTATQRYQWNMDMQDDFLLRGEAWAGSSDCEIIIEFNPSSFGALQRLADFDVSASINMVTTTGLLRFSGFTGVPTATLNGTVIATNTTPPVMNEINVLSVRGNLTGDTLTVLGTRSDMVTNFFGGVISAVALIDHITPANSYTTRFSGNGPIETAIGDELGVESAFPIINITTGFNGAIVDNLDGLMITNMASFGGAGIADQEFVSSVVLVEFEVVAATANTTMVVKYSGGTNINFQSVVGTHKLRIPTVGSSGGLQILFNGSASESVTFKNITAKAVPDSAFTRENGEPSGVDLELITRETDNSGWTGDASYPYAVGAND